MACLQDEPKKRHNYFMARMSQKVSIAKRSYRIILIGTGESGKSTFVKQMKLLSSRNQTFDDAYKARFKPEVYRNLVQALHAISENSDKSLYSDMVLPAVERINRIYDEIVKNPDAIMDHATGDHSEEFFSLCKLVWKNDVIQKTFYRSHEYQIIDCAQYFLDKVDSISSATYKPSDADVLQCRTKTLGIHTETITYNDVTFELVDVGGQRDQRSKWIEAMSDGVTAVIFLTDVSAYDMTLEEDEVTNRLAESVQLLREVWRKNPLRDKSIILFLNKQDKLEKKLALGKTDIETYFPDYRVEKKRFLYTLLKELAMVRDRKGKRYAEVWHRFFAYFIPESKKRAQGKEDPEVKEKEAQVNKEYGIVKDKIEHAFSEGHVAKWLIRTAAGGTEGYAPAARGQMDEEEFKSLQNNREFNALMDVLLKLNFFKVVCATHFIQSKFLAGCEQTSTRHVYPFPTTAIDKRNMDRVFESCKDIMQGKILTEIMG